MHNKLFFIALSKFDMFFYVNSPYTQCQIYMSFTSLTIRCIKYQMAQQWFAIAMRKMHRLSCTACWLGTQRL